MNFEAIVFYFFATLILASGAMVVLSKNIMHSAFALMFTLFGLAGMFALLLADFLAVSQIMIYVGGILVLIIFAVMLTSKITGIELKSGPIGRASYLVGGISATIIAGVLAYVFTNSAWVQIPLTKMPDSSIEMIGASLMTDYLLAFEVAAVLLLIALVGAALIARKDNLNTKVAGESHCADSNCSNQSTNQNEIKD